jgi:NAD(P)-dependent dehydrogenase (short-subunit alcohol dehydrogenase family)
MTKALDGATALIVGGTGGIGLATARRFAASGARVAIAGRDRARGEAALATLAGDGGDGGDGIFVSVDVTDPASVEAAVAAVVDRWGTLDCAFNNAGWEGVPGPVEQQTEADWQRMIETKLNGTWRCLRAEIPRMRSRGHGTIVNMAGNWGLVGFPNFAAYCAAAHGIVGLTKAAALEVAGAGLRINAVCPGAVDAPMLDRMVGGDEAIKTSFGDGLAIGRICTAEEVANAVVWLCSPESSYVNGASLPLDGGGAA